MNTTMEIRIAKIKSLTALTNEFLSKPEISRFEKHLTRLNENLKKACEAHNEAEVQKLDRQINDYKDAIDTLFEIYCDMIPGFYKYVNLPCSNEEIEQIMRDIGIDGIATTKAAYSATITNAPTCPSLCGLKINGPNLDNINSLARRLASMLPEKLERFDKIVGLERKKNPSITSYDLNIASFNTDNYTIYNARDLLSITTMEQLGYELDSELIKGSFVSKHIESQSMYKSPVDIFLESIPSVKAALKL